MNEEDTGELYMRLSEEFGIPIPIYIFYERSPEIMEPRPGLKIIISRKIGGYFTLDPSVAEDPFGFILLSKGSRGIRKDEVVHEFLHYLDHLIYAFNFLYPETDTPTDLSYSIRARMFFPSLEEKSVRSRARKIMAPGQTGSLK